MDAIEFIPLHLDGLHTKIPLSIIYLINTCFSIFKALVQSSSEIKRLTHHTQC